MAKSGGSYRESVVFGCNLNFSLPPEAGLLHLSRSEPLVFVNKQEKDTGSQITGIWWTGDSHASENVQMTSALSSFIMSGWQITYGIMEISKWKPYWSALRTNVKKVASGRSGGEECLPGQPDRPWRRPFNHLLMSPPSSLSTRITSATQHPAPFIC